MVRLQSNNPFSCLAMLFVGAFFLTLILLFLPILLLVLAIYAIFARNRLQSTYAKIRNQARWGDAQRNNPKNTSSANTQDDAMDVEYTVLNGENGSDNGKI